MSQSESKVNLWTQWINSYLRKGIDQLIMISRTMFCHSPTWLTKIKSSANQEPLYFQEVQVQLWRQSYMKSSSGLDDATMVLHTVRDRREIQWNIRKHLDC